MGWTDWIVKFEHRQVGSIAWEEIYEFSKQYGTLTRCIDAENMYDLTMTHPIGECVHLHGDPTAGVNMISIDRPTDNAFIRPFIYTALTQFNMVLCDQNFTHGYSAVDLSSHIPEETLHDGVTVIDHMNALYA